MCNHDDPSVPANKQREFEALAAQCIELVLPSWSGDATYKDKEAFQRVLRMQARQRLAPFPKRPGRPRSIEITQAEKLYRIEMRKLRRGQIKQIKWRQIAAQVIPNFEFLSKAERNESVARVRNSVKARLRSQAKRRKTTMTRNKSNSPVDEFQASRPHPAFGPPSRGSLER